MGFSRRRSDILNLLQDEGSISISELAHKLGVSLETVRRDVKLLTDDGSVIKMHGSIGLPSHLGEAPFERRMRENADEKRMVARDVASTIRNGDSIMMDTGTTTSFLARELLQHRDLTVVTNSYDIARTLSSVNNNHVYVAGGELRSAGGAVFGVSTINFVSQFFVMHAIISIGAIDLVGGLMDYDLEEAEFARMVISRGSRSVVVTDHTKFGRHGLARVCGLTEVGEIVADRPPPTDIALALQASGVKMTVAKPLG